MSHEKATVFVVDDDPLALTIVGQILRDGGYAVETFEGPHAFLESEPWGRHGCVVLDMSMPELSGLDLQATMAERGGTLPVVFVTGSTDVKSSVQAMKGGAVDFLLKPVNHEDLLGAVQRAVAHSARSRLLRAEKAAAEARFAQLTPREREVCMLLSEGLFNKQIAEELGLLETAVKSHRARVMEKLEVGTLPELLATIQRLRAV